MTQALPEPHIIHGTLPDRYPRGWFCIGANYEFTTEPKKLNYFGTSLVAYRGADDGQVHVLNAYCAHMGANLGSGHVKGDSIICPFHEWSWGTNGVCNDIPYAKKIPEKAVIKAWPTMEENELVFVWNDPDGGPPIEEQRITRDEEVFEEGWTPWVIRRVTVDSNCRELIDNMADKAHFGPVHGMDRVLSFSNISEGHTYTQLMTGVNESGTLDSKATYYGPGYMLHTIKTVIPDSDETIRMLSLVMNVPTSMGSFEFLAGYKHRIPEGAESREEQIAYVNQLMDENEMGVFADLAIWQDKCVIDNPVLCDGDGPVTRLRQWYDQFLVPIEQVPASLSQKRVYDKNN